LIIRLPVFARNLCTASGNNYPFNSAYPPFYQDHSDGIFVWPEQASSFKTITMTTVRQILHTPVARIIFGFIFCLALNIALQNILGKGLSYTSLPHPVKVIIRSSAFCFFFVAGYIRFFAWYEKRAITEFLSKGIWKYLLPGLLLGSGLQALTVFVIYLDNGFHIISINNWSNILPFLFSGIAVAIVEETFIRGIIFRIAEEKLGSYLSLAVSSILFGALHLVNPNSSIATACSTAIIGGLLMGAAYIYSRSLWFSIAIHFAWNFSQTSIFGAVTSGHDQHESLFSSAITGNHLITGGSFGPEGSIQACLFCLIASVILLVLSHRQHKIKAAYRAGQNQSIDIQEFRPHVS
jgi:uncharacterized protein